VLTQALASAGTITVLFNLNSRRDLANSTRDNTGANSMMYVVDTTVEPRQLFREVRGSCLTGDGESMRHSMGVCGSGSETDTRPGNERRPSFDLDLNLVTGSEPQTRSNGDCVSPVDLGLTRSTLLGLKDTPGRTLDTRSKEWWI